MKPNKRHKTALLKEGESSGHGTQEMKKRRLGKMPTLKESTTWGTGWRRTVGEPSGGDTPPQKQQQKPLHFTAHL